MTIPAIPYQMKPAINASDYLSPINTGVSSPLSSSSSHTLESDCTSKQLIDTDTKRFPGRKLSFGLPFILMQCYKTETMKQRTMHVVTTITFT
jgi:hypothetical protein